MKSVEDLPNGLYDPPFSRSQTPGPPKIHKVMCRLPPKNIRKDMLAGTVRKKK
jgi:hypothetical protein